MFKCPKCGSEYVYYHKYFIKDVNPNDEHVYREYIDDKYEDVMYCNSCEYEDDFVRFECI
jgi:hypothetical protein